MRRNRNAKIVATLGPASATFETIDSLFMAGADVFRLNFSHGTERSQRACAEMIRAVEAKHDRPISILADLQGPKLRIGAFETPTVDLRAGQIFRFDLSDRLGNSERVGMPHPEIFAAMVPGCRLLVDDGRVEFYVSAHGSDFAECKVVNSGTLSARKGVNVPSVVLPLSSLTPKDEADLQTALSIGVDWIALSFVQRPEDVTSLKEIVGNRASVLAKIEKPSAVERIGEIIAASDAIMVARGDLGVEMPPEQVPAIQRRIVRMCREAGRPVIVATQMLDSMVSSPVPTRAEASDVASAIYDGGDAVMLSAESASGNYPVQSVQIMDRIIQEVEKDPLHARLLAAGGVAKTDTHDGTASDAVCRAMSHAAASLKASAVVTYTESGHTTMRAARERPCAPLLSLTPSQHTARRMCLVWGVHSLLSSDVLTVEAMTASAVATAKNQQFCGPGDFLVIVAGMPFGVCGTTNLMRIARG